ncbi:MAG: cysteine--tRNA ligase, partial [Acidimicrobiaceae bacterium]|nr:cysteine--tRNA ligase [Acidimicrobiaceae bacterium]
AVTGKPFARHWLHQALVHHQGSKMSKSLGNLVFVHDLRQRHEPMAIRLALMSQHYRTPWPWHDGLLQEAEQRLTLWRSAGTGDDGDADLLDEVRLRLDDDLDVPGAVAAVDDAAGAGRPVHAAAALLGVALQEGAM